MPRYSVGFDKRTSNQSTNKHIKQQTKQWGTCATTCRSGPAGACQSIDCDTVCDTVCNIQRLRHLFPKVPKKWDDSEGFGWFGRVAQAEKPLWIGRKTKEVHGLSRFTLVAHMRITCVYRRCLEKLHIPINIYQPCHNCLCQATNHAINVYSLTRCKRFTH